MKVGIGGNAGSLEAIVAEGGRAERASLGTYSISNIFGHDAIGALAAVARETRRIELLTAIVPILGRHPVALAQQALTAQVAARGRFTLGIGAFPTGSSRSGRSVFPTILRMPACGSIWRS